MHQEPGRLRLEDLEARIRDQSIDTVINAITDLQGRLMGKRITGDFFLEHAKHGTHFCTYLLGTDMEMRTPAGYRLTASDSVAREDRHGAGGRKR
jgi:glutamine synthetase